MRFSSSASKPSASCLSLPPGGLRERFGKEAHRLHRIAAGDLWTPLEPRARPTSRPWKNNILDDAENNSTRLLFLIKQLLHPLLSDSGGAPSGLVAIWLSLLIDHGDWLRESLRAAVPTLDAAQILDLIRLRLESLQVAAGVIEIELGAETCAATSEQLRLFAEKSDQVEGPSRDLEAANRALARLRAEFGERLRRLGQTHRRPSARSAIYLGAREPRQTPQKCVEPFDGVYLERSRRAQGRLRRAVERFERLEPVHSEYVGPPGLRTSRGALPAGRITRTKTAGSSWAPNTAASTNSPAPTFFPAAGGIARFSANTITPKPAAAICSGFIMTG